MASSCFFDNHVPDFARLGFLLWRKNWILVIVSPKHPLFCLKKTPQVIWCTVRWVRQREGGGRERERTGGGQEEGEGRGEEERREERLSYLTSASHSHWCNSNSSSFYWAPVVGVVQIIVNIYWTSHCAKPFMGRMPLNPYNSTARLYYFSHFKDEKTEANMFKVKYLRNEWPPLSVLSELCF